MGGGRRTDPQAAGTVQEAVVSYSVGMAEDNSPSPASHPPHTESLPTLRSAMRLLLEADRRGYSDHEHQRLLCHLSDAMPEGIVVADRRGRVIYANETTSRLLGRERGEILGQLAGSCLGEQYGAPRYEAELSVPGNRTVVVEVSTRSIDTEDGRFLGSFAMVTDMTERVHAQAALRRSESDLRLLSAQLWAAQELERQRIARELHDGIGQALGGIKYGLETCGALLAARVYDAAQDNLEQLTGRIKLLVEEVRRIAMGLRPSTLDDLGILATIGWFSREFTSLYRHLNLQTIVDVSEEEIPPAAKTAIYRIVQEATSNVVQHAGARRIRLLIEGRERHVWLTVEDDGSGFDPAEFRAPDENARGLGLASMRERAEASGGRFHIESLRGRGTKILVTWPSAFTLGAFEPEDTCNTLK